MDKHLAAQGETFGNRVFAKLKNLLRDAELGEIQPPENYRSSTSELQQMVIDAVCERGGYS